MDQINKEYFLQIIEKYQSGTATKEEIDFLDAYYKSFGGRNSYTDSLDDSRRQLLKDDLRNSVSLNIQNLHKSRSGSFSWSTFRWAVSSAAAVIAIVGFWIFYSYQTSDFTKNTNVLQKVENDIVPGGNKAFLTLANGKRISLTDASNGTLVEQSGIKIEKTTDGQLVYTVLSDRETLPAENLYNIIETPKGGRYQIRLPDGSNVWLNAASKLIFPSSFITHKSRMVELNGEAYFEIEKDKDHPFIVKTYNQVVEVFGTEFNINSYVDEPDVKTTLLEGSIKVIENKGNDKILKPGQQSTLTSSGLKVENVDSDLAVAWKNNQFVFESDDIQYIMRMIARWYDVEVEYVGPIPKNKFGGAVSRFENVSEVLKSLESTGRVKFKIEGRRILVSK